MSTAVVLGGGLAGLLAAAALEPHARRVTVVEQDTLPDGPHPRRGLPQGDFSHILLGGGADALDALLPGTVDALLAAGAHRRPMPSGMLMRLGPGWLQAFESTAYLIACSRHLLDHIVRQRLRGRAAVTIREGTSVLGLTGDAAQVRGALVRNPDGSRETLPADLVVDATGRRSQAPRWLRALGSTGPREVTVDAGLAYAARLFDAPRGNQGFPVVSIVPVPGRMDTRARRHRRPHRERPLDHHPLRHPGRMNPPAPRPSSTPSSRASPTRSCTTWPAPPAPSARSARVAAR